MLVINPVAISFGPIQIYWYAICIVLGMALVYALSLKRLKLIFENNDKIDYFFMITIFSGIAGARIWSVLFNIELYLDNPISVFYLHQGGLAIHGGIILGVTVAYLYLKKQKISFLEVADIIMPLVLLAQACGRWGNFFNQEAYGSAVDVAFLQSFLPDFIINQMFIGGQYHHPTFLYESILNVIGFFLITLLIKKIKFKQGSAFAMYFIWYGIIRYFIESLRTDSLYVSNTSLLLVILGLIAMIGGLAYMIISIKKQNKLHYQDILFVPILIILILLCMILFILNPDLEVRMAQFTSILFAIFGSSILYILNKKGTKND